VAARRVTPHAAIEGKSLFSARPPADATCVIAARNLADTAAAAARGSIPCDLRRTPHTSSVDGCGRVPSDHHGTTTCRRSTCKGHSYTNPVGPDVGFGRSRGVPVPGDVIVITPLQLEPLTMNSTTETNDAAVAVAESDAPATGTLPPVLFPRDRRQYTRYLSPLHTGPGLQLFESPEHEAFGDGLIFVDANGNSFTQSPPNINYFPNAGGQSFSFGQILALAGDFYGVPSQPISDASGDAAQQQRFIQAFNTLYNEPIVFGTSTASRILSIMQDQSNAVDAAAAQIQAAQPDATDVWSQAYSQTDAGDQYDQRYNLATGASDVSPWWASQGTYMQLAATNWDHFGTHAVAAYRAGHACALQAAATGNYQRAYFLEAFACHFLTDLFSSGHLRTPRKTLHTNNPAADLCSRLMHDEDCYNGLVVQDNSANPTSWTAYGDKRLNDTLNAANFTRARKAVRASLNEVINALHNRDPSPTYGALAMTPNLSVVSNATDTRNWSPLYIAVNGEAQQRVVLNDLRCRQWSDDFLYSSTYWNMPSGGVHSDAGAPPGTGTMPAHPIAWQSHRIIGSNQDDLAPSAALVTNYDSTLTNTLPQNMLSGTPTPAQLDTAQQNTLCAVFRKTSSDTSNHHVHFLAIPMTDAPAFKVYTSSDISIGTSPTMTTNGGDPTIVATIGGLLLVVPGNDGTLYQATWSLATHAWSTSTSNGRQFAFDTTDSGNYKLLAPPGGDAAPRVAMCNLGGDAGLYLAFPARSVPQSAGNIVLATYTGHGYFDTPRAVAYLGANGTELFPRTNFSVSLVEFDGALVMAFADAASSNQIRVIVNGGKNTWTLITDAVLDASGNAVTTHSALNLMPYGGSLLLVVNDSGGNIYTYFYNRNTSQWGNRLIQGTSNGSTKAGPLQTKYALSGVSFEGAAYVVFTDKANGAPSIMTTATGS